MLLSDWYTQWKEMRIQAAVKEARAKAYKEGYAAAQKEKPRSSRLVERKRRWHCLVHDDEIRFRCS